MLLAAAGVDAVFNAVDFLNVRTGVVWSLVWNAGPVGVVVMAAIAGFGAAWGLAGKAASVGTGEEPKPYDLATGRGVRDTPVTYSYRVAQEADQAALAAELAESDRMWAAKQAGLDVHFDEWHGDPNGTNEGP